MSRTRLFGIALVLLAGASVRARAADFDSYFDWVAVGSAGPLYDSETSDGSLNPGDYTATVSLERTLKILTLRTQVGTFLYSDEIPSLDRESKGYALLSAIDRFGEDRWAVLVLGGVGYYDADQQIDFHAGLAFDYRFKGPWMARGEAVYHHEFRSVAVTVGVGYMF